MRYSYLLFIVLLSPVLTSAQVSEQTGWFASFNSIKFSQRWGMHLDVQLRSSDDLEYVRNVLFRPGITYYINKKTNVTAGYLLNNSYNRLTGTSKNSFTEHRTWQQFLYNQNITTGTVLAHRLRLEQRFIERLTGNVFSQRFRYFLRAVVPLAKQDASFRKGIFMALQDEIFLNLQNKDKLNGSIYDQNRAYIAAGYRLSPKIDIEAGYLNQSVKGSTANTSNNVIQLAVYTRL